MNADVFAEWLRRQGHHVLRTKSSYWYDAGPRVFQAFPYGAIIQPTPEELRQLLLRHTIAAIRYSTPMHSAEGIASYHVVVQNPYAIEMLHHQTRSNILRGLHSCKVEKIPLSRLAKEGWTLQLDTLRRQGRASSMSQAEWQRICRAAEGLPGFEAWGALVDEALAATILTTRIDDTCYVPYAQCLHEYMPQHVNHALFYVATCEMLAREGVREIFYSLHSLDAPESINEFKFRMGFAARPVRQRVVMHPLLALIATPAVHRMVRRAVRRYSQNPILSKTEGMLRFYLQGKQPLELQPWPNCLEKPAENIPPAPGVAWPMQAQQVK